jgi:hypothetical protein
VKGELFVHGCGIACQRFPMLPNVEADVVQLQPVFLNLILNA